jgi:DNA/RNA-binding domain of Phe-tRNA-synthetase-like protein
VTQEGRCFGISNEVFALFPGYLRGVVIVHGLVNPQSPDELVSELRAAEEVVRGQLNIEKLAEHPRLASWREAYRLFGAKPSKFRPSIEAMVRRVLKNEPLPSINSLVDIGNIVSLRHLVPAGCHAIDLLTSDMELRPARGDESFTPLDAEDVEHPLPGEIIFAEGTTVLTRRWTWRQGKHTLVVPETTAAEFNVDGLPPVLQEEIEETCGEIAALVQRFCGGEIRCEVVSRENPRVQL